MIVFEGFIPGKPIQQGSLSPMPYMKKDGHLGVSIFQKKTLLDWRNCVAEHIKKEFQIKEIPFKKDMPVYIEVTFLFTRPKSVSEKKRPMMIVKPDLDKLQRSVGDALTGIVYYDDSQIVDFHAKKRYCTSDESEGMYFKIWSEN